VFLETAFDDSLKFQVPAVFPFPEPIPHEVPRRLDGAELCHDEFGNMILIIAVAFK
jgi:hypothetical protein